MSDSPESVDTSLVFEALREHLLQSYVTGAILDSTADVITSSRKITNVLIAKEACFLCADDKPFTTENICIPSCCRHEMCISCLDAWKDKNVADGTCFTCPFCRAAIESVFKVSEASTTDMEEFREENIQQSSSKLLIWLCKHIGEWEFQNGGFRKAPSIEEIIAKLQPTRAVREAVGAELLKQFSELGFMDFIDNEEDEEHADENEEIAHPHTGISSIPSESFVNDPKPVGQS